jgi:lipoprotein-releasing system permease protein
MLSSPLNSLTCYAPLAMVPRMTSWAFSRKIALRYLWSKRSEAFISIISVISIVGVAIGVMVLNIVMAVMTGFEHELREKIVGTDSHVVVAKVGGRIDRWKDVVSKIDQVSDVSSVSPFTYHQVLIRTETRSSGLLLRGVERDTASADQVKRYMRSEAELSRLFNPPPLRVELASGEESEAQLPAIVVGHALARSLGLYEGVPVSVLSPQVTSTPFGLVPSFRRFLVVGVYSSGLVEYESGVAYVSLEEAQKFFGMKDAVSGLEVRVKDINAAPQIARQILDRLGGAGSGFTVSDWTATNKPLWDALQLEKRVYFIVLLLIIVMASFSIITTLIMIVLEKRKDIAVMKTLGASTKSVGRIFRIQGAVIGGLGTAIGLLLGFLGCVILKRYGFPLDERIFQMSTLPIKIDWQNFAVVGAAAFLICFFATVYPARRAARLEPSDVLRYD